MCECHVPMCTHKIIKALRVPSGQDNNNRYPTNLLAVPTFAAEMAATHPQCAGPGCTWLQKTAMPAKLILLHAAPYSIVTHTIYTLHVSYPGGVMHLE